jgi:hypothetical protein
MGSVNPSGLTKMSLIVGVVTVMVNVCVTLPSVAVMVVVPAATDVTKPLTSTVAAAVEEELQVTSNERSRVLPSL